MNQTQSLTDAMLAHGILPATAAWCTADLECRAPSGAAFLGDLLRRGKLTRLQAVQIGRGRCHHLAIGRYILHERLGSGGMGRVFLARHRELGRFAALKLVRLDRRHCPTTRARFLREVRMVGRLNHENVVHAHDAGVAHRSLYLAMEYIPGPDLGRAVGAFDPGRACEYARQAALGLQHMHDRGLVHRDVKPANLGLALGGRLVKVLDVGLARSESEAHADASMSRARRLIGSPDYASPEQVLDSRRVDPRADLYGLGCTLYHLLSGRVPFPGGTPVQKALRHLSDTPCPIELVRSDLPAGLGDLVRRLMARKRKDRIPTAAEAAAALTRFAVADLGPVRAGETTVDSSVAGDWPTLSES